MSETMIVGISIKVAIGSAVGSAIGMILGQGTLLQRAAVGLGSFGSAIMLYPVAGRLTGAALNLVVADKWMPAEAELQVAGGWLIGLVGLIVCQAIVNATSAVRDRAEDFVGEHMQGRDEDRDR